MDHQLDAARDWFVSRQSDYTVLMLTLGRLQVQLALRSKGLRDDITVIVIDALPSEDLRTPPPLQRRNGHPTIARWALSQHLTSNLPVVLSVASQSEGRAVVCARP